MVLQRERPNTFWGWTTPGTKVTVEVAGKKASGTAASDGRWVVKIVPPKVGGPYVVKVDGTEHVELTDVLVGDVWICSGQSNMEFGLTGEVGAASEIAAANDPMLRIYLAPKQQSLTPQRTNPAVWKVATPETVVQDGWGGFSAVGYHFGKALRREVGVPIGLVEISWGGTNAESWASRESLAPLHDFDAWFPRIDAAASPNAKPFAEQITDWLVANDLGSKPGAGWESPTLDTTGWKSVAVPNGFSGLGLDNFDGMAWFRKDVELTEAQAAGAAALDLGIVDDFDDAWVNGTRVASLSQQNSAQSHPVPSGLLHAGKNVIAVRVLDTGGPGGFTSPAESIVLRLGDGSSVPLAGEWLGHVSGALSAGGGFPHSLNGDPNVPTSLSNGMVEPEVPLAIKGAIWYQGENNAARAEQYRRVLPTMIADWRRRFGQGDFPFYIVSLANYMARKAAPGDDEWAELREAQALTAKRVKNSGLAVTIDVGDAADIHPRDKKTVGERLALIALAKDYDKRVVYSGPTYRSLSIKGSEARVSFDHTEGGLVARGGPAGEFAIAGADQKWHWATARIEGDTVVLTSSDVPKPVAVRYAWQANPTATLTNGAGLPAVPFRTDDWPMITAGKK